MDRETRSLSARQQRNSFWSNVVLISTPIASVGCLVAIACAVICVDQAFQRTTPLVGSQSIGDSVVLNNDVSLEANSNQAEEKLGSCILRAPF